jgi:hypothetical protein
MEHIAASIFSWLALTVAFTSFWLTLISALICSWPPFIVASILSSIVLIGLHLGLIGFHLFLNGLHLYLTDPFALKYRQLPSVDWPVVPIW